MTGRWQCLSAVLWLMLAATTARAQEGTIVGLVQDQDKGVLPGVTVTAVALDTGRQFTDVTNERGEYRLVGMPAAEYRLQAELAGFATSVLPKVELLVGQNATNRSSR